jgi:hypothetical protein
MTRKTRSKKTLADKVRDLAPEFADAALIMSDDQLKDKLVEMAKYDEELEEAKKNDLDLQEKKAVYDAAKESYTEPLKANRIKRKFILEILANRHK